MASTGSPATPLKQLAMVFDLNKCLGCQTCSVACKVLWTQDEGEDYQWWCTVNTLPGQGHPRGWEEMGGGYRDGHPLPGRLPTRAEFGGGLERDALRVPGAALGQQDASPCVWIAEGEGAPRPFPVRVLALEGEAALIDPGPGGWPAGALVLERPPSGEPVLADAARAR